MAHAYIGSCEHTPPLAMRADREGDEDPPEDKSRSMIFSPLKELWQIGSLTSSRTILARSFENCPLRN